MRFDGLYTTRHMNNIYVVCVADQTDWSKLSLKKRRKCTLRARLKAKVAVLLRQILNALIGNIKLLEIFHRDLPVVTQMLKSPGRVMIAHTINHGISVAL